MNSSSVLVGCVRCPQCHLVPELTIELEAQNQFVLTCPMHIFSARGRTAMEAVTHWNRFIENVVTEQVDSLRAHYQTKEEKLVFDALHGIDAHE